MRHLKIRKVWVYQSVWEGTICPWGEVRTLNLPNVRRRCYPLDVDFSLFCKRLQLFILQASNSVPQLDLPFDYDPTWKECRWGSCQSGNSIPKTIFLADPIYKLETNSMLNFFTLKTDKRVFNMQCGSRLMWSRLLNASE